MMQSIAKWPEGHVQRDDIEFTSEGETVRGWLYRPDTPTDEPTAGGRPRRRMVLRPRAGDAALRGELRRGGDRRARVRLPQPRRLRRRGPPAPRPVGTDPRLPERPQLPRVARRRRRCSPRRLGHLLLGRSCADPRRHRSAGAGDRQPDPRRRRLSQHASRPRHDGVSQAVGAHPRRPPAALHRSATSGCTSPTPPPSPTATCRRGRSPRRTTRSRRSSRATHRCTRTAARSSRSTCCSTTT